MRTLLCVFRIDAIDGIDLNQLVVLAAVTTVAMRMRRAGDLNLAGNGVAGAQAQAADNAVVDKDVGSRGAVTGGAQEGDVIVYHVQNATDGLQLIALADLQIVAAVIVIIVSAATAVAAIAAPTTVAALVIIVVIVAIAALLIIAAVILIALIIGAILGVILAVVFIAALLLVVAAFLALLTFLPLLAFLPAGAVAASAACLRTRLIALLVARVLLAVILLLAGFFLLFRLLRRIVLRLRAWLFWFIRFLCLFRLFYPSGLFHLGLGLWRNLTSLDGGDEIPLAQGRDTT